MNTTDFPVLTDVLFEPGERPAAGFQDTRAMRLDRMLGQQDARSTIRACYPRIAAVIDSLWGTQQLQNVFVRWIYLDQDGRRGWPASVMDALLQLSVEHATEFGFEGDTCLVGWRDTW
jgi:hypothetical protein